MHITIISSEWFRDFYDVFNLDYTDIQHNVVLITNETDVEICGVSDTLEADITQLEVIDTIRALNNNEAPGPDGFSFEFYKYAAPCIVEFLTQYSLSFFVLFFYTGTFPLEWSEAVIQPIHKKGDIRSPDSYRSISLLNNMA